MGENHKSQPRCFLLFINGGEMLRQECYICWWRLRAANGQRGENKGSNRRMNLKDGNVKTARIKVRGVKTNCESGTWLTAVATVHIGISVR
jgi:hypothetical protein